MVFSDITKDYRTLIKLINEQKQNNEFFSAALKARLNYKNNLEKKLFTFLISPKKQDDIYTVGKELSALENSLSEQIAIMSTSLRKTTMFISQINNTKFLSENAENSANAFCNHLNDLMDIIEEYVDNKIKNNTNSVTFTKLVSQLEKFHVIYNLIFDKAASLTRIEDELVEPIPLDSENPICFFLDIRSYKQDQDIVSFTDDLKLLANCLQNLERLVNPSENHSIYICKIESGSLQALLGSKMIDISNLSELVTSISNAIKTWKLTPAEKEKTQAEAEKLKAEAQLIQAQAETQHIQNEGTKLAIVNAQINFLCEKFSLDSNNPDCIEQIQQFCLPLITYMERNPIGSFNGVDYDITKEVHLLENSNTEN